MGSEEPPFQVRLARDARDLHAAQHLRYRVFVQELGADGPSVNHQAQIETDDFDPLCDHLLLIDPRQDAAAFKDVVGVYRLLRSAGLPENQPFYSESEFDLTALRRSGRALLELGRSCVALDYRGGTAMLHLWNGLADYVLEQGIEVMFGPASFHGTDTAALAQALSYLYHNHLAPPELRVAAKPPHAAPMGLIAAQEVNRAAALADIPALIKAYLRLGGYVGDGAWVDHAFNTVDVCLVMDTAQMSARHRGFYLRKSGRPQ